MSIDSLLDALNGRAGELDSWLELRSEEECRTAILALVSPKETLRDTFAAQALTGVMELVAAGQHDLGLVRPRGADGIASSVYEIADAMLAARGKP